MNIPFLVIILLLLYFILIYYVYQKLEKSGILIIVSITWWFNWLIFSTISISGYFKPGIKTISLIVLFFISLCVGIYLKDKIIILPLFKLKNLKIKELNIEEKFYKFLIVFILPLSLMGLSRTFYLLATKYSQSYYRSEVFGLNTGTSDLFLNSNILAGIYWNAIIPLYWASLLLGIVYYLKYNQAKLLLLSFLLFIIDSLTTVGRFSLHYIIFTLIILVSIKWSTNSVKLNYRKVTLTILGVFLIIILMFSIRLGKDFKYVFDIYIIGYHTSSLTILDQELNNPQSIILDKTLGSSFWTGLMNFPRFISANILGFSWVGEGDLMGGYLHNNRLVGFNNKSQPFYNNAFGTIFFSMYRDGGFLAIILYGIFFGYLLGITANKIPNKNMIFQIFHISIIFILIYGLFQPFTSGPILQAIAISITILCMHRKF
ncbi:MAG: oligosaccharide repeat unit polymerase [Leptospiraceae bacterium]|nr:oligosaccharide repeat unit polymerase [Leptospiraceae bacterium]